MQIESAETDPSASVGDCYYMAVGISNHLGGYICEMWISTHIVPTGQKLRNNKEENLVQLLFIPLPIFLPKSEIWV